MATVLEKSIDLPAMPLLVLDPAAATRLLEQRRRLGQDRKDEVWNGTYVMSPDPTYSHYQIVFQICKIFDKTQEARGACVSPGGNVSDREVNWVTNFRCPDVVVFFPENPAKNLDAVLVGGPDFAVEVLSPYDRAREKLPFYADVKTRECLYIDRQEECVELYRLSSGQMELVRKLTVENGAECQSEVLQLGFRVVSEADRVYLEVARLYCDPAEIWRVDLLI